MPTSRLTETDFALHTCIYASVSLEQTLHCKVCSSETDAFHYIASHWNRLYITHIDTCMHTNTCMHVYRSMHLSIYPSCIYLFIKYLSIHLSNHPPECVYTYKSLKLKSSVVETGFMSAQHSSASGRALSVATAGVAAEFRITARDRFGNVKNEGHEILSAFLSRGPRSDGFGADRESRRDLGSSVRAVSASAREEGVSGVSATVTAACDANGTVLPYYLARYTVTTAGWYWISVSLAGLLKVPEASSRLLVRPGIA